MGFKKCFVSTCLNSSENCENKLFISIPNNKDVRTRWFSAVNRPFTTTKDIYCCEDHFDLEVDMENWMQFKLIGSRVHMKKDVVPHKLIDGRKHDKQTSSQLTHSSRKRKLDTLQYMKNGVKRKVCFDDPSTSWAIPSISHSTPTMMAKLVFSEVKSPGIFLSKSIQGSKEVSIITAKQQHISQDVSDIEMDLSTMVAPESEIIGAKTNEGSENTKSTSFNVVPSTSSCGEDEISVKVETSEDTFFTLSLMDLISSENDFSIATGIQSYQILDTIVGLVEISYGESLPNCKMTLRERIILTYVKLKQNLSWEFLALIFKRYSAEYCRHLFYITLEMLFKCLKIAIHWLTKDEICKSLPECFRDFEDTRIVVDCMEIYIWTLIEQELTYSNHKRSQTCKIMTGITPGGIISYLSKPCDGRHTNAVIFEESNLMNLLEPGDAVMTDQGFLIEGLCARNNWKLIRPPFIKHKKPLSQEEIILTSKIAKARIQVERCNQQIKAFAILGETMAVELVPVLNDIFTVVCATVNLSSKIFKHKLMKN